MKKKDPLHREILWKPDRFQYLHGKEKPKPNQCVFCAARDKGPCFESLMLWSNDEAMVLLNKFPYNNGHLLIIPTKHVGSLNELSKKEYEVLHKLIKFGINAVQDGYDKSPQGMNVGLNLGAVAGAGIPEHIHYHIIPRWLGDSNFFPVIAGTKVISETLEQTYKRLLPYFNEVQL